MIDNVIGRITYPFPVPDHPFVPLSLRPPYRRPFASFAAVLGNYVVSEVDVAVSDPAASDPVASGP